MAERELQLELSEEAKDLLVDKGWDPAMGARPLRRAIQRYIEDPLADFVLRSQVPSGSTVLVEPGTEDSEDGDVKLTVIEPAPKPTPVGVGASESGEELRAGARRRRGFLGGRVAPGVCGFGSPRRLPRL